MHGTTEHFGIRLLNEGQFRQIFITDTNEMRIAEIVEQFGVDYWRLFVEGGNIESDIWFSSLTHQF